MNISYDYYRIFYYAAKCGSFTHAAKALLNNQPNITRAIKALERELGCTLFVRSNKGAILTPEGEKLYRYIAAAFQQIEAGEAELSLDKTLQKGSISIAVSEVALHGLLLPVLEEFRRSFPGVRIRISNCSTPRAISELKHGAADFALVTTPTGIKEDMKAVNIRHFSSVAVCGTAYAELKGRVLTLRELAEYPIVSLDAKTKTHELYTGWFAEHGLVFSPDVEAATADQILPMIRHNLGIGFVPELFLEKEQEKERIIRLWLQEQPPARSICLVTKKDRSLSIAARELAEMLCRKEGSE
ncbi:MAG: LysR family transcriptional regulator [Clostridia bacterium]|nr:LysR family transcriptional regulator [Clostridia bacterium]